ncbi:MAG: hypothetical protein Q7J42_10400 [Sulfuritalea sp.]|nr:hypothetical protein [Sulfuritalea sp.]
MSRLLKSFFIAAVLAAVAISPAWADRYGHHRGGGGFWWGPGLLFGTALYLAATAPPPTYYPAPVYTVPVYTSPTYVQQPAVIAQTAPAPAPVPQQNWWYYCAQAAGYYPYVRTCPSGWTQVSPVPPGQ